MKIYPIFAASALEDSEVGLFTLHELVALRGWMEGSQLLINSRIRLGLRTCSNLFRAIITCGDISSLRFWLDI